MRFERLRRQALPCSEAAGWLSDKELAVMAECF